MEHNYLTIEQSEVITQTLFQRENNLDGKDNLDELPELAAVYAVCGRANGKPANPRYIGETDNLRAAIKEHFNRTEADLNEREACFKEFMLSIKIKELVFQLMPEATKEERIKLQNEWTEKYKPDCNKELNQTY